MFISCFAYSSSGTPNFLAIATCDDVSLTDLRLVFELRVAEATVCVGGQCGPASDTGELHGT